MRRSQPTFRARWAGLCAAYVGLLISPGRLGACPVPDDRGDKASKMKEFSRCFSQLGESVVERTAASDRRHPVLDRDNSPSMSP